MFGGFYKKNKEAMKDPDKAMDQADKALNKGMSGFMTKAFLGKDFVNDMNSTMQMGRDAMDSAKLAQELAMTGVPATAEVLSMQNTGTMVNNNPVVIMQLKVHSQTEPEFDTTVQTMVNIIAIPRVGDTVNIRYSATDHSKVAVY